MNYQVYIRPDAEEELQEIIAWYYGISEELTLKFFDEFYQKLDILSDTPLIYQKVHHNYRRVLLNKFPYAVYYQVFDKRIGIFAIIHGAKNPEQLTQRLN